MADNMDPDPTPPTEQDPKDPVAMVKEDEDEDSLEKQHVPQMQGPMNWRKGLRPVKSPAQEEILETAKKEDHHLDGAISQVDRFVKERRISRDERLEDSKIREKIKAMPALKKESAEKKSKRPMIVRSTFTPLNTANPQGHFVSGIPRRRPLSPGGSGISQGESAFTTQVVMKENNSRPVSLMIPQKKKPMSAKFLPAVEKKLTSAAPVPFGRRTPSPNLLAEPTAGGATNDIARKRVERVQNARLYLLQQNGPNSFLIGGDSPDHKYRVTIGPQKCSCGRGAHCVHLLFVMLRVFQVAENDPCLWSKTLKNFEVENLFRYYHARRTSRIPDLKRRKQRTKSPQPQTPDDEKEPVHEDEGSLQTEEESKDGEEEENTCPICLLEMEDGESLVECSSCQNKLHHHCISIWFAECRRQREPLICPLCRAEWRSDDESLETTSEDQLNNPPEVPPNTRASSPQNVTHGSDLHLPHAEPISEEQRPMAQPWIEVLGEDLVACLLSKSWVVRETALRHLGRAAISCLLVGVGEGRPGVCLSPQNQESSHGMLACCCDILALMCADPVYKVFVAALRTLRIVLGYTPCRDRSQQERLQRLLTPLIDAILLKCSDGNRRTSQLSLSTLVELIKGQRGELAIGREIVNPGHLGIGGVTYILKCIVIDYEPQTAAWQWLLGRLCILERFVDEYPTDFVIHQQLNDREGRVENYIHYERVMAILNFAVNVMEHSHAKIGKVARRVYLLAARLQAHNEHIFKQIIDLLGRLQVGLQARMRRRLQAVVEEYHIAHQVARVVHSQENQEEAVIEQNIEPVAPCTTPACSEFDSAESTPQSTSPPPVVEIPEPQEHKTTCHTLYAPPNSPEHPKSRASSKTKANNTDSESSVSSSVPSSLSDINAHALAPPNSPQHGSHATSIDTAEEKDSKSDVTSKIAGSAIPVSEAMTLKIRGESDHAALVLSKDISSGNKLVSHFTQTGDPQEQPMRFMQEPLYDHPQERAVTPPPTEDSSERESQIGMSTPGSTDKATCSSSAGMLTEDLSDMLMSPCTPEDKLVSFTSEVTNQVQRSRAGSAEELSAAGEFCPCKEEMEREEAKALAAAMEFSCMQLSLPQVPGLSDHTEEETITIHVQDEDGNTTHTYLEGLHWERGPMLGTGAFSTCYQARDTKTGVLMAVKQISYCRNSLSEQEKVVEAVQDEIRVMAKLNHPNVVRIIGATQQGCHFFMFTEWMPGGSVAHLLDRYGPFTESVIISYTQQVLRGLAYLHDHQLLHRDLKGANILVDSTGQRVRIADFGASARLASKTTGAGEFQGQLLGTIAFMAPEVLKGESYGRTCDVWSVGCVMIEMATSKPPWGASAVTNHLALIFRIASSQEAPPIPENLTPAVRDLMLRCLEVERKDRPTARELLKHPLFTMYRKT